METMIAVLMLAFAMTVFGASLPSTSQVLLRSRSSNVAIDACQQQLENWRNIGYSSLPAFPSGSGTMTQSFTPPTEIGQGATGTVTFRRVNASYATTTTDTGRVLVEATITWGGSGIRGSSVTLTTLMLR
jgi:hypothetical protein